MLGLLSYKSLVQMQQSRELPQQSLTAVSLRSPVTVYVESLRHFRVLIARWIGLISAPSCSVCAVSRSGSDAYRHSTAYANATGAHANAVVTNAMVTNANAGMTTARAAPTTARERIS
jgi:hypothetical protein